VELFRSAFEGDGGEFALREVHDSEYLAAH
jgi:hypothetical protein